MKKLDKTDLGENDIIIRKEGRENGRIRTEKTGADKDMADF